MVVDHERAWLLLKQRVAGRQGIGVGSLMQLMAELEVECGVEEGLPERALRLYGTEFFEAVVRGAPRYTGADRRLVTSGVQPAPSLTHASGADGDGAALPRAGDGSKEEQDDGGSRAAAA